MGINLASYVGATQVRRAVIGDGDRAPTPAELDRMKSLVRDAMRDGAVGVSSLLQYCARALCHHGGTDRSRRRRRKARRYLRHSHAQRRRRHHSRARRSHPHRARSSCPRRNLASQGGGPSELGAHGGNRRAYRRGSPGRSRNRRQYVCVSCLVQHILGIHSAVGA